MRTGRTPGCLTLPRGVVNRSFVFGSLARSERILIVETENFHESVWCRKEAWAADALSRHGLATTERLTLLQAEARVATNGPRLQPSARSTRILVPNRTRVSKTSTIGDARPISTV